MGPAHLSAAVPDGRLPALAPHLAAMRRCGSEGHLGPREHPCVCQQSAWGAHRSTFRLGERLGAEGGAREGGAGMSRPDTSSPRPGFSPAPGASASGGSGGPQSAGPSPAVRLWHVTSPLCPRFPSGAGMGDGAVQGPRGRRGRQLTGCPCSAGRGGVSAFRTRACRRPSTAPARRRGPPHSLPRVFALLTRSPLLDTSPVTWEALAGSPGPALRARELRTRHPLRRAARARSSRPEVSVWKIVFWKNGARQPLGGSAGSVVRALRGRPPVPLRPSVSPPPPPPPLCHGLTPLPAALSLPPI